MKNITTKKAFTLVELLVAIGIFSILVAIGVGGFVHALHTQKEIASLISVQSNASIALEQMAREIRTGYLFCHDPGQTTPNSTCQLQGQEMGCQVNAVTNVWTCNGILDFQNADGQNVDYRLGSDGSLDRSDTGTSGTYIPITGNNVVVQYLTFTLFGNLEGDHWPPRITISMGVIASSTDPALESDALNLQTTISARAIDCTQTDPVSC